MKLWIVQKWESNEWRLWQIIPICPLQKALSIVAAWRGKFRIKPFTVIFDV